MFSDDIGSWKEICFLKPGFLYLIFKNRNNHEFHWVSQGTWSRYSQQCRGPIPEQGWHAGTCRVCVGPRQRVSSAAFWQHWNVWADWDWVLHGSSNKSVSPYSLTYLLFKSVILIFIATFCECTALWDSLGKNLSESMVIFLDKVYKDNQKHLSFSLASLLLPGEYASCLNQSSCWRRLNSYIGISWHLNPSI